MSHALTVTGSSRDKPRANGFLQRLGRVHQQQYWCAHTRSGLVPQSPPHHGAAITGGCQHTGEQRAAASPGCCEIMLTSQGNLCDESDLDDWSGLYHEIEVFNQSDLFDPE